MKYLILLIILSGCTVQQRCAKHITKATKLGCLKFTNDTIIKYDTLKGFKIDTIVQYSDSSKVDTLYLENDGVKSQTIIKWKEKIVSQTITKQDTIFKTVSVDHNIKVEIPVKHIPWWVYLVFVLSGVAIIGLIFKR